VVIEAYFNSAFILKVTVNQTNLTIGADAYIGSWRSVKIVYNI
jgi:hypothetical protein